MDRALILAIALMLMLEGAGPLLFPNRWRRWMRTLSAVRNENLRQIGLVLVSAGLLLLWLFGKQSA